MAVVSTSSSYTTITHVYLLLCGLHRSVRLLMHPMVSVGSAVVEMLWDPEQRPVEALVEAPLFRPCIRSATQGAGVGCIDALLPFGVPAVGA